MHDAGNMLEQLERWYAAQCNGDWEHTYGITIETLDNPGWSFKVELRDTYLSGWTFEEIAEPQSSDHREFFHCRVKDDVFTGMCPPNRLREVISVFLRWAETSPAEQVENPAR
ncbi:immunity 53 family protein [Bradyrhizobium sp. SSUT77]|uniref:immunity 53 family protein n=1 Tax=Bradyrhizobium sp. SSUT77 TaxID=3040603 RepID=UPI00244B39AC|nr:immunity 53 family protein [Bradyrhizobium sp. SSUT77]MDH2346527.1 immunity 53 family protein [Bradyrhizobium sp. SSUT77]